MVSLNMHIILHALSLLVVIKCVTVMNINYISAESWETGAKHSTGANTVSNAETEEFITAKYPTMR